MTSVSVNKIDKSSEPLVIDTVIQGNNNFVSTLDHLPCDITRSLWLIQSLNLKNERLQKKLVDIIKSGEIKDSCRIRWLIRRNSKECKRESQFLVNIVQNHLGIIKDEIFMIELLKTKLEGWTSEAVEKRWKEWGEFKRNILQDHKKNVQNKDTEDTLSGMKIRINLKDLKENELKKEREKEKERDKEKEKKKEKESERVEERQKLKQQLQREKEKKKENQRQNKSREKDGESNQHSKLKKKRKFEEITENKRNKAPIKANKFDVENINKSVVKKQPEERYCFCNGPSLGKMVCCDNPKCKLVWFHFKCVGLFKGPGDNEKWFCSKQCEEQFNEKPKKKKKRRW